jgi:asparagine synthase (glutamine-hydrolysing)
MCGIAGAVSRSGAEPVPAGSRAAAVLQAIQHRGPDGMGEYRDAGLWFGHRRLSIIDLSPSGSQPMATGDGRFVICFNGEVYNYRELADALALVGLRSHSDTEVLLRAFAAHGVASLRRLNGIYAFALYDREARKLWLVRDRLGVKPLYYRLDGDGLAFGSEIKAITAISGDGSVCDLAALHEFLYYGNALGGRTMHHGITQLLPGHYLELDLASFEHQVKAWWTVPEQAARAGTVSGSTGEMIAETRRLLDAAVRRQLVSDVPVGVFLSGGVDSSAITAFAVRHYLGRLATYAAGFDDRSGADERPQARRVAEHYGTDHHELHIGGGLVADLVERMVHQHDMPFSDAANIPLYLMASRISSQTKVVLQGDGGDEVFGGYRRYVTLRSYGVLHPASRVARHLVGLLPRSPFHYRVRRYLHAYAAPDLGTTMALLLTLEDGASRPASVFTPRFQALIEQSDPFARYRACQAAVADHDIGNQMSLVDLMVELPDIFLEKVDRATMAASLEVRVPFLDDELVGYVSRIPGTRKMPWGRKKWLLKQALAGIVPDDVLYGPKTGFNVPFGYWLRTALKPLFFDHLATFERTQPGVLRAEVLQAMFAEYECGARDQSYLLWKVLNFMIWCNNAHIAVVA